MLAIVETHPIQYHAPVYRTVQQRYSVPVTVIYGSNFSVAGYWDREFGATFAWDTDLLSGYRSIFLSRVERGGPRRSDEVTARGLRSALAAAGADAILLPGYSPRFYQMAFVQAARTGRPLLFRGETTDHAAQRSRPKAWLRDLALRTLYLRYDRLLYVGRRSYRHFKRLGCPDRKLVWSPYCIDPAPFQADEDARRRFRSATRTSLGIRDDRTVLLLSGKLSPWKRPSLALAALRRLASAEVASMVLVFLGDGEERPRLEELARADPSLAVRFVGFQNQTQLSPYYHAADLLVLPSRSETWGLVVNEALHHGLPCVVSDAVGCAPDLIESGRTGRVFRGGSATSLAEEICRTLPMVGRADVRLMCRRKVEEFSVEHAAAGVARAYHAVLRGGDGNRPGRR